MPLLLWGGAQPPGAANPAGVRSVFGRWVGGFGAPPKTQAAGVRSVVGRWVGGFGAPPVTTGKKKVGWMPEWRFRHDPEELERRLKAQKESAFSPHWLDRFLKAEEEARDRIGKAKSAKHRAALEAALEQTAARVSEAIDAGYAAPDELIVELEAAASATRVTASIKHAEHVAILAAAYAEFEEEDAIEILLLH